MKTTLNHLYQLKNRLLNENYSRSIKIIIAIFSSKDEMLRFN
ncbi:hypothetical protein MB9_2364 [Methanobacterium formicicum]|jgi:hypothetical protein|uniref:Uncharacterized protein n=1 Tax=Methanobacterium formicicum TaxID=2162 RepID=A0A0S4FSG5_METFO|nr:hypothetical protein MB9_2364 [Methanobacterium formicicum]